MTCNLGGVPASTIWQSKSPRHIPGFSSSSSASSSSSCLLQYHHPETLHGDEHLRPIVMCQDMPDAIVPDILDTTRKGILQLIVTMPKLDGGRDGDGATSPYIKLYSGPVRFLAAALHLLHVAVQVEEALIVQKSLQRWVSPMDIRLPLTMYTRTFLDTVHRNQTSKGQNSRLLEEVALGRTAKSCMDKSLLMDKSLHGPDVDVQ